MAPIVQSLRFFSRYGLTLTVFFVLAAIPSEMIAFYLSHSLTGVGELKGGVVDLMTSVLIEPLATGAAIFFIQSRDQGGESSIADCFWRSTDIYFQLAISYLLVFIMVMLGLSLYLIPGFYLLYKLMFVEYRVALNGESPMEAIRGSFSQTKGQWSMLLMPFMVLLIILLASQTLIGFLLTSQGDDLLMEVMGGVLEAPFMALAVVVGFRLFSLSCKPLS